MTLKTNKPGTVNHSTIACPTVWNKIFSIALRFPRGYMLVVIPLALMGYAYLLLFPVLFLFGIGKLIHFLGFIPMSELSQHLVSLAFWSGVTLFAGLATRQMLYIQFPTPEGININPETASRLHKLLKQIKHQVNIPVIDRIIITEQLSLDIVKTPKYPLPVWSSNTLVVGLPLMQCLSPEYFKCALARKLIQHSKHQHVLPKLLSQLRSIWSLYSNHLGNHKNKNNIALYQFFKFYAPFYKFISIPVANYVELLADQDTLRVINDEDLLQTIEKVIVTKIYLEKQYWPKIRKMIDHNRYKLLYPYSKLEQVLQKGLTPQLSKRWLDTLYNLPSLEMKPVPDLRSRMNNIGRSSVRIPEKTKVTAAHYFLDNAYRDIITEVNQLWLSRSNHLYDKPIIQKLQTTQQTSLQNQTSRMNTELFN